MGGFKYFFRDFGATGNLSGITKILNENQETLLLLDFDCYAQLMDDASCLMWWETNLKENKTLEFRYFSFKDLSMITDPSFEAKEMRDCKEGKEKVKGLPISKAFSVQCYQSEGSHPISSPSEFVQFKETLVLSDYQPGGNGFNQMFRAIFAFDWLKGQVRVIPQDWFNQGSYDFSYQGITRIARLSNGSIVGEGVRLGAFELDETCKQIKKWTSQNPFHMIK